VDILKPAVGSANVGFSSHVGQFDSLLDTVSDESPSRSMFDDDDDDGPFYSMGGTVTELLKSRHNCQVS
jgi:hypothetical protein